MAIASQTILITMNLKRIYAISNTWNFMNQSLNNIVYDYWTRNSSHIHVRFIVLRTEMHQRYTRILCVRCWCDVGWLVNDCHGVCVCMIEYLICTFRSNCVQYTMYICCIRMHKKQKNYCIYTCVAHTLRTHKRTN